MVLALGALLIVLGLALAGGTKGAADITYATIGEIGIAMAIVGGVIIVMAT